MTSLTRHEIARHPFLAGIVVLVLGPYLLGALLVFALLYLLGAAVVALLTLGSPR